METSPLPASLPRLQFPKIVKWGDTYEFPYPYATLNELFCLLKRGGNSDLFLGKDYALSSLIIHAIKERKFKDIAVFFKNARDRHIFICHFKRAIACATRLFTDIEGENSNFVPFEAEIATFNEEYIQMRGKTYELRCEFIVAQTKTLRGASTPTADEGFSIMHGNKNDFSDDFTRRVLKPLLTMANQYPIYELAILYDDDDDEAINKRGKGLGVGNKARTLRLFDIVNNKNIKCDANCRSCLVKHETWEDELKQQREQEVKYHYTRMPWYPEIEKLTIS
jgi:hypothetical protein